MKGKQVTEKKKTAEELKAEYVAARRQIDAIDARLKELQASVDEYDRLRVERDSLTGLRLFEMRIALGNALIDEAIASAPPVPVEAVVPTDREVATRICKDIGEGLGQVMRYYWK